MTTPTPIGFAADVAALPWQVPFKFSIGYPRDADLATGVDPTRPGPYWFYAIASEILNTIAAAGLTFNPADTGQFLLAIEILLGTAASIDFGATPLAGVDPLTVAFTDLTAPDATAWLWNFGDGATSTVKDPVHQYTAAGTYTVSLTATANGLTATKTKTGYITVSDPAPEYGYYTSILYPILVKEEMTVGVPVIRSGALFNITQDTMEVGVPRLQSGSLIATESFISYTNWRDENPDTMSVPVPALHAGTLDVTINYVSYTNGRDHAPDTMSVPVPTLQSGTLVVTIGYVNYTNWRDQTPDTMSVPVPSLISGSLT